jgi:hypothetical protein
MTNFTTQFQIMLITCLCITMAACSSCSTAHADDEEKNSITLGIERPNHYLILLDLSDRILEPGQKERDIQLILALQQKFIQQCTQKQLLLETKDKFTIKIADQKSNPLGIRQNEFEEKLSFHTGKIEIMERRKKLDAYRAQFENTLNELYTQAALYKDKNQYSGADIWGFLRDRMPAMEDDSLHLYILTDGYLDFEDPGNRKKQGKQYTDSRFLNQYRNSKDWMKKWTQETPEIMSIPLEAPNRMQLTLLEIYPKYEWQDEYPMLKRMWLEWCSRNKMNLGEQRIFRRNQTPSDIIPNL